VPKWFSLHTQPAGVHVEVSGSHRFHEPLRLATSLSLQQARGRGEAVRQPARLAFPCRCAEKSPSYYAWELAVVLKYWNVCWKLDMAHWRMK